MSTLVIDITPLAVDTGVPPHIVRDVVRHAMATGHDVRLQTLGQTLDARACVANGLNLAPALVRTARKRLDRALARPRTLVAPAATTAFAAAFAPAKRRQRESAGTINLAFDPLHLLAMPPAPHALVYVTDLTPMIRPAWHAAGTPALHALACETLYDPRVRILAASDSVARDLWANLGVPRHRSIVLPLYADDAACPVAPRAPQRQFLCTDALDGRRNILGLIEGFRRSGLERQGYSLRLAGDDGRDAPAIHHAAAKVRGVVRLGGLRGDALATEYSHCCALTCLTFWDSTGLHALDALRHGVPLLLSDTGALPEIGGPGAHYADPGRPDSIATALVGLATAHEHDGLRVPGDDAEAPTRRLRFTRDRHLRTLDAALGPVDGTTAASRHPATDERPVGIGASPG